MRNTLFLLGLTLGLLCLSGVSSHAQDVIIKLDGTEIEVYVDEVLEDSVQYRRYDNPAGPTYKLSTSKIARIEYENGVVEEFNNEPVEETPELSDEEKKEQEAYDREVQKKIEEGRKRMEKELKKQEKIQQRELNRQQNKGRGLSFGALMNWERRHSDLFNGGNDGLTYEGLRPSIYLDYHFVSWFFIGVNGSFAIRHASTKSNSSSSTGTYKYDDQNVGVNGHLGFHIPFSSRKYGIGIYGGPTVSWNLKRNAVYSVGNNTTYPEVPNRLTELTVGVKLKTIVCLNAEYHRSLDSVNSDFIGIPAAYWTFGVGLGF